MSTVWLMVLCIGFCLENPNSDWLAVAYALYINMSIFIASWYPNKLSCVHSERLGGGKLGHLELFSEKIFEEGRSNTGINVSNLSYLL